jgi:stage V sporulation protein AC
MKKMLNEDYKKIVESKEKSPYIKNFILAYVVGGLICVLAQIIFNFCSSKGFDRDTSCAVTSVSLIFLTCLFTGLGLYDKAAKHAGAGTLVPITGFANSMVAPAMEFKSEGHIMGIGGKMFLIAGPVLVFGIFLFHTV